MTKELNPWQRGELHKAEAMQKELIELGFMATRIVQTDESISTVFYDGKHDYRISRDYSGNIDVYRFDHPQYEHVSSSIIGEVYTKYRGGNVKVGTAKKIQAKIDAEKEIHATLAYFEVIAIEKHDRFIEQVRALEREGVEVKWSHDYSTDWDEKTNERIRTQGKLLGGSIERGGLEFSFSLENDGYISKKTTISYAVDASLDNFMLLSDNKYRHDA